VCDHLKQYRFQPMERAAALAAGVTTYFTGRPCVHGHVSERMTCSGQCLECNKIRLRRYAVEKKEVVRGYSAKNYQKHAEKKRQAARVYREQNPEKVKSAVKKWAENNPHKISLIQRTKYAAKLQRTPQWLTEEDYSRIEDCYKTAKQLEKTFGAKLDVDHIVPLLGRNVCGLHVPWNLMILSATENRRKSNRLIDFPWQHSGNGVMIGKSALPWNLRKETHHEHSNC